MCGGALISDYLEPISATKASPKGTWSALDPLSDFLGHELDDNKVLFPENASFHGKLSSDTREVLRRGNVCETAQDKARNPGD